MPDLHLIIDGKVVKFEESISYPWEFCSPPGYCRIVNGQPCSCNNAYTLRNGNCPCAPTVEARIVRSRTCFFEN